MGSVICWLPFRQRLPAAKTEICTVPVPFKAAQFVGSATKNPRPQTPEAGVLMTLLFAASLTETFRFALPEVACA